jgi:hypothetical protein
MKGKDTRRRRRFSSACGGALGFVKRNRASPATSLSFPPYPFVGLCCALILSTHSSPSVKSTHESSRHRQKRGEARHREGSTRPPPTSARRGCPSGYAVADEQNGEGSAAVKLEEARHRECSARPPPPPSLRRGLPSLAP